MTKTTYGPYPVEYQGPGIHAGIMGELPPELVGKYVTVKVVDDLAMTAAMRTLFNMDYIFKGGDVWEPPLKSNRSSRGREDFNKANPVVSWNSLTLLQQDYWNKIYDSRKHRV